MFPGSELCSQLYLFLVSAPFFLDALHPFVPFWGRLAHAQGFRAVSCAVSLICSSSLLCSFWTLSILLGAACSSSGFPG
eukprot:531074-Karenia_brevis.AAC.1